MLKSSQESPPNTKQRVQMRHQISEAELARGLGTFCVLLCLLLHPSGYESTGSERVANQ